MNRIFRVTVERCIACGKCELACAFAHGRNGTPSKTRINVFRRGPEKGIPVVCFQCYDPACVAICPTSALARDPGTGAIEMLRERCISCRMCVAACPFGNMLWDDSCNLVQKCDLCGGEPRCVPFCPTGALDYLPAAEAMKPRVVEPPDISR
jgi:anaerobic carbon-monoxide dehydrogenase iron sulfur subunit